MEELLSMLNTTTEIPGFIPTGIRHNPDGNKKNLSSGDKCLCQCQCDCGFCPCSGQCTQCNH